MLVLILAVANIPAFLFFGWVLFDSKEKAADSFFDTIVAVAKVMLVPRFVRIMVGMDTDDAWGVFQILLFLSACVAVVWLEHWLITTHIWTDLTG